MSKTLTEAISEDHREMYDYHDQYVKASGNVDAQDRWAHQLIWEIARHAVGEEIVVYPLMEKHLGEQGFKLAEQDRKDHQFVKDRLYKLESMSVGTQSYHDTLTEVMQHLHEHNDSEEQKDLPLLEPRLGVEGSQAAATSFSRTKKFVPTRPHPSAPNRPPFETVVGLLAAPMDKLLDLFEKFPTDEMKEEARKDGASNI